MEFAVAPFHPPVPLQIVAPSAAQGATVIRGGARPVALPANSSCHVQRWIAFAEIRGTFVVEEIEGEFFFGFVGVMFAGKKVLEASAGFLTPFLRFDTVRRETNLRPKAGVN